MAKTKLRQFFPLVSALSGYKSVKTLAQLFNELGVINIPVGKLRNVTLGFVPGSAVTVSGDDQV